MADDKKNWLVLYDLEFRRRVGLDRNTELSDADALSHYPRLPADAVSWYIEKYDLDDLAVDAWSGTRRVS